MGAHIINYSGGGTDPRRHDAILAAERKGILFIAAAGMNGQIQMNTIITLLIIN